MLIFLYRILNGKISVPSNFGKTVEILFNIWVKRGLPIESPDISWVKQYLELAISLRKGEKITLGLKIPEPFSESELHVVKRLLFERRSIRQWKDEPVSDELIHNLLYAGLMAPRGCNVPSIRYLILKSDEEKKLVSSDIPVDNALIIVVCQDMRVYHALKFDKSVPQNIYYDAAAVADHICLMAHALGLGACWLTHGSDSTERLRKYFGLPDYIESRCHIAVGWPDESPLKSQRMSVREALLP